MKALKGFLATALLVLAAQPSWSQNFGEITGTVMDPSSAVIAGARVTITNKATNQVRQVQTNQTGNYTVPFLVPGVYDVQAEKEGFNKGARRDVTLQVGAVVRIDFNLEVGAVAQAVEVYGGVPLLATENTAVGTVIENKRIIELPLNGRNYLQLVALSPNVTAEQVGGGFSNSRQGGERGNQIISVGGQRMEFNRFTLDGVENTDVNFNSFIIRPSIDALQEFKVQTGIYPAEFGRATSHIIVTTKSGTNNYHGTVFEFLRNSAMDGREWRQVGDKNPFRRNQFGFTLGGPVRIPKIFDGRNKLFFLANFEALRDRKTLQGFANVATDRMRNGDFSGQSRPIYDPLTRVFTRDAQGNPLAVSAQQFPNNIIPKERFHPIAVKLLEFYPQATRPGDNFVENYVRQRPRNLSWEQFTQRIDFTESSNSSWFGRFSWGDEYLGQLANFPTQEGRILTKVYQGMISNTRTFGPTVVNEFRFGYNQFQNDVTTHFSYTRDVGRELGIVRLGNTPTAAWGTPEIGIGDGLSGFGESNVGPYVNRNHSFTGSDTVSTVRGKHSLKLGGEIRRDRFNQFGNETNRGVFSFSNIPTFDPTRRSTTGFGFASYLLGEMTQAQRALDVPTARFRATSFSLFFDDSWKLTPKLTVNLGLRYEFTPPYHDKGRALVNAQLFDPGVGPNGIRPDTKVPILTRVGSGPFYEGASIHYADAVPVQVNGENILCGPSLVCADKNDFAPRLGIAYSPTSHWTIRAGAGFFYVQDVGQARFDMSRNLAGRAFFRASDEAPNSPLNDPWKFDTPDATGCSNWAGECAGRSTQVQVLNVGRRTPYLAQWLFNVQRQLTENIALELGYLGNSGSKLERIRSYNEPIPRSGPTDARSVEQRRPWPVLGRVHTLDSVVNSNYHGASLKLQQRFAKGLTYLVGFTWSKAIDNGSAIRIRDNDVLLAVNGYNFRDERGLSQYHVGRRLVTSTVYEMPFGKGKRFANRPGLVDKVVGGWQVGSILTFSDGVPVTPTIPETNGTDWGDRPHATGISPIPQNRTADNFWNIAAFDGNNPDLFYKFGSAGRNSLIGPGLKQWDFSLVKHTRIRENQSLEFRFEGFNFPNHPNWNTPPANVRVTSTFGKVTTARTMRELQFSLKYIF